jgi:hypothetical protein
MLRLVLSSFFLLVSVSDVGALTITDAFSSARHFGPSPFFGGFPESTNLVVGATISPSGSPTTAVATQGATTLPLSFISGPTNPDGYVGSAPFNASLTGAWSITATRGADTAGPALTNVIPGSQVLPLVQSLTINGTGFTPTLTWVLPDLTGLTANLTAVTVFSPNQVALGFFNQASVQSQFTVPTGVLQSGQSYFFDVSLGNFQQGLGLVNDSETFTQSAYSPDSLAPIPEPTTLLLFGTSAAGLGLAGWRRRYHA